MLYLKIKDLKVSAACLGTAEYGGRFDENTSMRQMDLFLERGGNFFDTAHVYNDWRPGEKSRSEKTLGRWMERSGSRESFVISTKGAHPPLDNMSHSRVSRQEIETDLSESLDYLRTSYIDLYFLHRDDTNVPVGEIVEWMNEWIRQGKIRYWGCSNWTLARIKAANEYAQAHGLSGITCNQAMWSYAAFLPERISDKTLIPADREILQYQAEENLALMAFTSQAKGVLARMAAGIPVSEGTQTLYGCPENEEKVRLLKQMHQQTGLSISQLCLLYFLSLPFSAVPITAFSSEDQLDDSLALYTHGESLLPLAAELFGSDK